MPEHKYYMRNKIKNVQQWLASADSNFECDQEVKGQLNLLLAQAEMQTLQAGNTQWYKRYGNQLLALTICAVLILGISYRHFTNPLKPDKITPQNSVVLEQISPAANLTGVVQLVPPASRSVQIEQPARVADSGQTDVRLSAEYKRDLIRQAQNSLYREAR